MYCKSKMFALVLVSMLLLCTACQEDHETLQIGLNLPLTGDLAALGIQAQNASQMFVDSLNDSGGLRVGGKTYHIELIVEDNQSRADLARAATNRLLVQKDVLAMVGPLADSQAIRCGEVAEHNETPMISPWSTNPETTLDKPWVFRAAFLNSFQAQVLVDFVSEELEFTRAAVLFDVASDYSKGLAEDFRNAWETRHGAGAVVAYETFAPGTTDFSAQLNAIAATDASVLFVPQNAAEVHQIVQQAQSLGLDQMLVGSDSWSDPQLLSLCGDDCEGMFFSAHYISVGVAGPTKLFIERYVAQFGEVPTDVAALTWDSWGVLLEAIASTGGLSGDIGLDRSAVRDALASIEDYYGVTGRMTYTPQGDPIKCVLIIRIREGQFTFYKAACP